MSAHSTCEPLAQTKPQLSEHHHPQVTQLNHKKYINSHTTLLTHPSLSFLAIEQPQQLMTIRPAVVIKDQQELTHLKLVIARLNQ